MEVITRGERLHWRDDGCRVPQAPAKEAIKLLIKTSPSIGVLPRRLILLSKQKLPSNRWQDR